jgi:histone deacetylase complex subunit SAP18
MDADAEDDTRRRDRADPDTAVPDGNNASARRTKTVLRTLDELRVQPGDWLSVSIVLPASAKPATGPAGLAIRGAEREREETEGGGHWRGGGGGGARGRPAGLVRGGGHTAFGRDREPGSGLGAGRDRAPPRPDSPPPRQRDGPPGPGRRGGGRGGYVRRPSPDMTRGGTSYRPNTSRSRSRERRSRSPVGRRRNGRYDRD